MILLPSTRAAEDHLAAVYLLYLNIHLPNNDGYILHYYDYYKIMNVRIIYDEDGADNRRRRRLSIRIYLMPSCHNGIPESLCVNVYVHTNKIWCAASLSVYVYIIIICYTKAPVIDYWKIEIGLAACTT